MKILILLTAKDAPAEIYVPIEIRNVTIVESKVIYLLFVPSLAPILGKILFNFKQDPYLKIQILLTVKERKEAQKTPKY